MFLLVWLVECNINLAEEIFQSVIFFQITQAH